MCMKRDVTYFKGGGVFLVWLVQPVSIELVHTKFFPLRPTKFKI